MLLYCLKCRKITEAKKAKFVMKKNGRKMVSSRCEVWLYAQQRKNRKYFIISKIIWSSFWIWFKVIQLFYA